MDIEAAVRRGDVETVRQLLAGTRPPILGPSLIDAVTRQDPGVAVEMTRLLIEHGASVNATADGFSPLFDACRWGHAGVVRLLLDRSGPHGIRSVHEHLFNTCYYTEVLSRGASRTAVAHLLLERGAEVVRPMPNGMSTLDLLACKDRPEMKKLIRKFLAMRVRRCVLGPVSEHPRRQVARELIAPKIAAFLV